MELINEQKYQTYDLSDFVEKLLFMDQYTENFLRSRKDCVSNCTSSISADNKFKIEYKVWKVM